MEDPAPLGQLAVSGYIERNARYRKNNRAVLRDRESVRRHGPDIFAEFAVMWEAQQGKCYLCGRPLDRTNPRKAHVDHDHRCCPQAKSCRYCRRGIACNDCNTLIGLALDDPQHLRRIADNLEAAVADATRRLASKPSRITLFGDLEVS